MGAIRTSVVVLVVSVVCLGAPSASGATIANSQAGVASSGPSNSCLPDGWWVGLQSDNTDLNLFYEHTGSTMFNGCPVADEPLAIPPVAPNSVPAQVVIPAGTSAQITDSVTVYGGGVLLVACPNGVYPDWKTCTPGASGSLTDTGYNIIVQGTGQMDVAPGAVVQMDQAGIYMQNGGTFESEGATLEGPSDNPAKPGSWLGLDFQEGTTGSLNQSTVSGGGGGFGASNVCQGCAAAVLAEGSAAVTLSDSTIDNPDGNGVEAAAGAEPALNNDSFSYCTSCGFSANAGAAVRFDTLPTGPTNSSLLSHLTSSGFDQNAVSLAGGTLTAVTSWPDPGIPYILDGAISVGSRGALTLLPNVRALFSSGITVESGGSLTVAGTPLAPVTLSSIHDFAGSSSPPKAGDWSGIVFQDGSMGSLSYSVVRYAGKGGSSISVGDTASPIAVQDTTTEDSSANDVSVSDGGTPVFRDDTFGPVPSGSFAIDNVPVKGSTVMATPDYWSRSSGPGGSDSVSSGVMTSPYYVQMASDASAGALSASVLGNLGTAGSFGASATGGPGGLVVGELSNNPSAYSPSGSPTAYFDIRSWSGSTFTSLTVRSCHVAAGQTLLFLHGSEWRQPSTVTVPDAHGCVSAIVDANSKPHLQALIADGEDFADGLVRTSTALTVSPGSAVYGQALKLTATVKAINSVPSGSVTITDNSTRIGSFPLTSGKAVVVLDKQLVGPHSFVAQFVPATGSVYAGSESTARNVAVAKANLKTTLAVTSEYTTIPNLANIAPTNREITFQGFVSGDTVASSVAGTLTCKSAVTARTKPGVYPISQCQGLTSPHYSFVYEPGTVTVIPVKTKVIYGGWSANGAKGSFSTSKPMTRSKPGYFEATLLTVTGKPVTGRIVTFTLGRGKTLQTCLSATRSGGVTICAVGKVTVAQGWQPLAVSFAGDGSSAQDLYDASEAKTSIRVTK